MLKYYDVTMFNSDVVVVDPDYTFIAQMVFRIKTDSIHHYRTVYSIIDWLGSIGGVEEILRKLLVFLFGGYLQFNAVISTFNALSIHDSTTSFENDNITIHNLT